MVDLLAIVRGAAGGGGGSGTAARSRADRQVLTAARLLAAVGPRQGCGAVRCSAVQCGNRTQPCR